MSGTPQLLMIRVVASLGSAILISRISSKTLRPSVMIEGHLGEQIPQTLVVLFHLSATAHEISVDGVT